MILTLYRRPLSCLSSLEGMKDPTLAPVKRYSWRANKMTTLSNPGINVLWSVCHKDETVLRKSFLVKLSFSFFWFAMVPSAVKVFLIHYLEFRMVYDGIRGKMRNKPTVFISFRSSGMILVFVNASNPPKNRSAHAFTVLTVGRSFSLSRPWVEPMYQRINSLIISWLGAGQPREVL